MIEVNGSLLIRDNEFWLWSVYTGNQFYILVLSPSVWVVTWGQICTRKLGQHDNDTTALILFIYYSISVLFRAPSQKHKLTVTLIMFAGIWCYWSLTDFFKLLFLADGKCSVYFWAVVLSKLPGRLGQSFNNHWQSEAESAEGKCHVAHLQAAFLKKENIFYINVSQYLKEDKLLPPSWKILIWWHLAKLPVWGIKPSSGQTLIEVFACAVPLIVCKSGY